MRPILLKPVLKEAWHKVKGSKKAFLVTFVGLAVLQLLIFSLQNELKLLAPQHPFWQLPGNILLLFLCAPLVGGFSMLGLRRARDEKIYPKQGFLYFKKILPLFFTQLLVLATGWILMFILFDLTVRLLRFTHPTHEGWFIVSALLCAIILIAVLLAASALFSFANILVIDQNKNPFQAYKTSLQMAFPHLKVLMTAQLVFMGVYLLGALLAGIGLLWAIPFSYIASGIFYRALQQT